jgi:hypothetical protein
MKTKEEIDELYQKLYTISIDGEDNLHYYSFVEGYTQCQEDMADKKYTEEDINEMACDFVINVGGLPKTIEEWQNALWKFYQSLNKQD